MNEYRAWQPHHSLHREPGMYEVTGIEFYSEHGGGEAFLAKAGEEAKSSEFFEDIHLMRRTGLKDAGGQPIFVGDILSVTRHYGVLHVQGDYESPDHEVVMTRKAFEQQWPRSDESTWRSPFSITWIGQVHVTPMRGTHLINVQVSGHYYDKAAKQLTEIHPTDEDGDPDCDSTLHKSIHKFKLNSELRIIGNIYETPELLESAS